MAGKTNHWQKLNMIFLALFTAALVWGWNANSNRINDIQKARRESCVQTYRSFREVFQPFFVKHPTGALKKRQDKFNRIIDRKIRHCAVQTHTATTTTTTTSTTNK